MNIVVTGGTKGIGRAIVELFAEKGFDVIITARNESDLNVFKSELTDKFPTIKVFVWAFDIGKKEEVMAFSVALAAEFSQVDVLVNNAGVFKPGTICEEEDGVFESIMNINIAGSYHLTRALMPLIRKTKDAHIFNICSTASIIAYTNGGSYSISKFAMLGFSKVLREELKSDGIKVTAVLPGATYTNSWVGTTLPESRFMPSFEIAKAVWGCYDLKSAVVEELLIRPQLGDL